MVDVHGYNAAGLAGSEAMARFLQCISQNQHFHHLCKEESKRYLACRMDR